MTRSVYPVSLGILLVPHDLDDMIDLREQPQDQSAEEWNGAGHGTLTISRRLGVPGAGLPVLDVSLLLV